MKKPKDKKAFAPTGPQRAAALLLSLDRAASAALLERLDPALVAEIASAMSELDPRFAEPGTLAVVYKDLVRHVYAPSGPRAPAADELAARLEAALGRDKAKAVIARIEERRRVERPFAALEQEPPGALGRVLASESAAVAALVLAHFPPERSAEVLSSFDPEFALDVVRRMASLTPPGFETLANVADGLAARVREAARIPSSGDPKLRLESIAKLLTLSEQAIERAVLEGLDASDQPMAEAIREFMFTWDDLAEIDKRGMQKILSSIETRTLAVALKACPKEVEENVMQNLSVRVRAMVADERDLAGPLPMAEVQGARNEILRVVRGLMESGEFKPARAGEELVQ